jgi:hypothetical protein
LLLFMSYAVHYREGRVFWDGLRGVVEGLTAAKRSPLCRRYQAESALQETPAIL